MLPSFAGTVTAKDKSEGPFAVNLGPLGDITSGLNFTAHGRSQALTRPPICPAGTPNAGQIGEQCCRHGISAERRSHDGYRLRRAGQGGIARYASCRTDSLSVSSKMPPWPLCLPFCLCLSISICDLGPVFRMPDSESRNRSTPPGSGPRMERGSIYDRWQVREGRARPSHPAGCGGRGQDGIARLLEAVQGRVHEALP